MPMAKSFIEWTDSSWNPATGCTKVSPGCDHCYAERLTKRRGLDFSQIFLHRDRLDQPIRWKQPRMVFVNSMSDFFHPRIPFSFTEACFGVMIEANHHIYQILTKRPGLAVAFWDHYWPRHPGVVWPRHIWLGVSVETQKYAPRLDVLARVPVPIRFVSAEPLLGPLDLWRWLDPGPITVHGDMSNPETALAIEKVARAAFRHMGGISWVIIGGESGPGARPMDPRWAAKLIQDCEAARVPVFLKQLGGHPNKRSHGQAHLNGRQWKQWPYTLQEE